MNPRIWICPVIALTAAALRAGPAETAIVDALKLSSAHNYSWISDVVDDAGSYTIDGKTDLWENRDYSLVTMPLPASVRRNASRAAVGAGAEVTAIFRGDEKFVIETPNGWKKLDELGAMDPRSSRGGAGRRGGRGGRGPGGRGSMGGASDPGESGRGGTAGAYSNLQPSLSRPHDEIAIIVAGYTQLKAEADGVSGTLSETNAKLLLVHAGQKDIIPLSASGNFRLWLKDGALTKYQVKLEGRLAVTTGGSRREVDVHQTATTVVREVGRTTFEVPEAAKKKLGAE